MGDILKLTDVKKSFGDHLVLDGLSFSVPEHCVYGFLGQNGAGKTTTMKIILGLLNFDGGSVEMCGERVRFGSSVANRAVGYLPDIPEYYGYMKPFEYLELCGRITGMSSDDIKKRGGEMLAVVGLGGINRKIGGFSRGMKQRLGIAQALMNRPRLLICDEPTSALDPVGRKEILDILSAVKEQTTVVFSTHVLSDVERICERVGVLSKGKLALSGTLSELKETHRTNGIKVEFLTGEELRAFMDLEMIAPIVNSASAQENSIVIMTNDVPGTERLIFSALSKDAPLPTHVEVIEPTLENLFMEVIEA